MMLLGPHGFLEDSLWLANLINFCDEVTDLVDERRRVDVIYESFRCCLSNILKEKLIKYTPDKWKAR